MQIFRILLRCTAIVLTGKNTTMRKAICGHLRENQNLEKLLPHINGGTGLVFTINDVVEVHDKLMVPSPCRRSSSRASDLRKHLCSRRCSSRPRTPRIEQVYDSETIITLDPLDIKPKDLGTKFQAGVTNLAAVSLDIGHPTLASVPHIIAYGYRNVLAIAAITEAETVKLIKDSSKIAVVATLNATAAAAAPATAAKEEKRTSPKLMIGASVRSIRIWRGGKHSRFDVCAKYFEG